MRSFPMSINVVFAHKRDLNQHETMILFQVYYKGTAMSLSKDSLVFPGGQLLSSV